MNYFYKAGAVFYALWGILHILGGSAMLMQESGTAILAMIGTGEAAGTAGETSTLVDTVLRYHSFNLIWIGALVLITAILKNWHNDRSGYWLNLIVVSTVDMALLITTVIPRIMALSTAMPGIVLWIPAVIFSTIGLFGQSEETHATSTNYSIS